jgi:hypothetical protein
MLDFLLETLGVDLTGFQTLVDFLYEKRLTEADIKELIEETVNRLKDLDYRLPAEDDTALVIAAWMADTLVNSYAGWVVSSVDGPYYNDSLPTVWLEDYYFLFSEDNKWDSVALELVGNPERVLELLGKDEWLILGNFRIPVFLRKDDDETLVIPRWEDLDYSVQAVVEQLITPEVKRILENLEESIETDEIDNEVLNTLRQAMLKEV